MITIVSLLLALAVGARDAYAHVLVKDSSQSLGAIVHVTPDDDPIAGKKAVLYFDMQQASGVNSTVTLDITQTSTASKVPVAVQLDGSLAIATYVFPAQGTYRLRYEVKQQGDSSYIFEHTLRVTRGAAVAVSAEAPRHAWAEAVLIGCGVTLLVVGIIAFNRRDTIAAQSVLKK